MLCECCCDISGKSYYFGLFKAENEFYKILATLCLRNYIHSTTFALLNVELIMQMETVDSATFICNFGVFLFPPPLDI